MTSAGLRALLPAFIPIPSLAFLMGTPEGELSTLARLYGGTRESYREESPQHSLALPAFAIAAAPVTNRLYAAFVGATGARPPGPWRGTQPPAALLDHPVVDVTWHDARACCSWLSLQLGDGPQLRLPSEAEWEHGSRGCDGRTFPWGEESAAGRANTRDTGAGGTMPVASYRAGASPYGLQDVAGNVWEWTSSLDRPYPYRRDDGREDPGAEGRRILRGGCYANPAGFARCACRFRLLPTVRNEFMGFRLARDIVA